MTAQKPSDILRKKYQKRELEQQALVNNITPKRLQKTPSQVKSERLLKKLNRGAVVASETVMSDCRACGGISGCDSDLSKCSMRSLVIRCAGCGQKVRVRVANDGGDKYLCPICQVRPGV